MRVLLKSCAIKTSFLLLAIFVTTLLVFYLWLGHYGLSRSSAGRSTTYAKLIALEDVVELEVRNMNATIEDRPTLVSKALQVPESSLDLPSTTTEQAEKPEAQHVPPGFQGAGKIIEEGDQSGTVRPKYKIVVGIPVAKRSPPTVLRTARQLVRYANSSEHKLLSWMSISAADDQEIKQGLADLGFTVHAYHSPYRELLVDDKKIKRTWNHPVQRVKWRTNERKLAKTHMYTKAHYMTRASSAHMTYDLS